MEVLGLNVEAHVMVLELVMIWVALAPAQTYPIVESIVVPERTVLQSGFQSVYVVIM